MKRPFRRVPPADGKKKEGMALSRNWHLLPRAFVYLRPYRKKAGVSVALTVLLALVAIAEPWPLAFIVDTVLHDRTPPGWVRQLVGDGDHALILLGASGILLVTFVSGALGVAHEYVTTNLDLRMVLDLRGDLYQHMFELPSTFQEDREMGPLMYRINNEPDSLGHVILAFPDFAQSLLTLAGMLFIAIRIDAGLALLSLAVVPFVAWSTVHFADRLELQVRQTRRAELAALSIVHEALSMIRVIVTFGREADQHQRYVEHGDQAVRARVKLTVREALFRLVVGLITAVGTAAVLWFGAHQVIRHKISTGELLIMLYYVAAVYDPLRTLTNTISSLQQRLMALRSMIRLLDTPLAVVEKPDAIAVGRLTGQISFEDVGFNYPTRPNTLRSISFAIQPGEAVGLVGPTGAGKSTLISLIPRHFDTSHGRITIDGIDVRDMTIESLRAQFSIVHQEPLLFSGTIKENIAYGRPGASDEEIENAARDANAHDFISRLPDGYETTLGERGAKISGGERQRIAVARAFLRDSPILILDEPTSSIDSRTETVILEAIERLMRGRTTILIAHRLSTVRSVDRILVLDEGRLVENGTHDELVARHGLYHELTEAQALQRHRVQAARQAVQSLA